MATTRLLFPIIILLHFQSSFAGFEEDGLESHNKYRSAHNTPPLALSSSLNARAAKCAEYYIQKDKIDHQCPHKEGAGENLYMADRYGTDPSDRVIVACKLWYDECQYYNYKNQGYSGETGHFTAMVWKESTELGIGFAKKARKVVVVALYSPHGNVLDNFVPNVLKGPCVYSSGVDIVGHSAVYFLLGLYLLFKVSI